MSITLELLKDQDWDELRRQLDTLAGYVRAPMPNARVYNSVPIATASSTLTPITFDSERWDVGNIHAPNSSQLVAPITGLYHIGGAVRWGSNAVGIRQLSILLNGVTHIVEDYVTATGADTSLNISTDWRLARGEFVELVAYQTSGVAVNVVSISASSPEFWMHRIGGYNNEGVQ